MKAKNSQRNAPIHKFFLYLIAAESFIIFLILALHPSDPKGRFFWLYSAPRFLELGFIAFVTLLAFLSAENLKKKSWRNKLENFISTSESSERLIFGGILTLSLSRLTIITLQAYSKVIDLHHLAGYAAHLRPSAFFFSLLGFEIAIWAFLVNKKALLLDSRKKYIRIIAIFWMLYSIFAIFSIFIDDWKFFLTWVLSTIILIAISTPKSDRTSEQRRVYFIAIMIGIAAFLFQITLQSTMRPYAIDNFYFQQWSSESMMNTVSLKDLQNSPLETLNNIHTSPPGIDILRVIFLHLWQAPDLAHALLHVDFLLYQLWAILYSFLGGLFFLWLSKLTGKVFALFTTFTFLLHPALLLYVTLLDNSFLTAFLIFILYYLLWKIKFKSAMPIGALIILTLILFFTRTIFQIPFFIVIGLSLFFFKVRKREFYIFLAITGIVVGLFSLKQYQKFGTISTSSFTGMNLNRSVGNHNYIDYWNLDIEYKAQDSHLPNTLTRKKKINGAPNYNHIQYLAYNQELIENYKEYMLTTPLSQILASYWENLNIYFRPSSGYNTKNVIAEHLPWRTFYDKVFSFPILNILLFFSGALWLQKIIKNEEYMAGIGLILPGLYIFLTTVLFEKGENMRFKFFLEPTITIFIFSQFYNEIKIIAQNVESKRIV